MRKVGLNSICRCITWLTLSALQMICITSDIPATYGVPRYCICVLISNNHTMASFDAKSLFTSIPYNS